MLSFNWLSGLRNRVRGSRRRTTSRRRLSERLESRIVLSAPNPVDLSNLDGTTGFRLDGIDANDHSGNSVSSAGDVNGDGFDDLLIGAFGGDPNGDNSAGESYVVFGKAGGFTSSFDLGALDGTNGFRLDGIDEGDVSGRSVSNAGDVNGDGFDDLLIGAPGANPNGVSFAGERAGESYVVFGKSSGFAAVLDLSTLDGTTGFRIDGIARGNSSGRSVSNAGDVNGDGFDDIVIGAYYASPNRNDRAGESYVVFGKSSGFAAVLDLSTLDGTTGFRLAGIDSGRSGFSVATAGDVNGDGFDDLVIGAPQIATNASKFRVGGSYVVFGKSSRFAATVDLSTLDGTTGFRLDGRFSAEYAGRSVSSAGDVNGDGFDDLLIGTIRGVSYLVFGKSSGFAAAMDLSTLNGATGFRLEGPAGFSVSNAGDVNGDGFDDLILGEFLNGAPKAGESFVVFGKSGSFTAVLQLGALDGTTGFRLDGIGEFDRSGTSVSNAGDVNGDGFDDLLIGADGADSLAGESYVVFGGNFTGGAEVQIGTSDANTLVAVQGAMARDILIGQQGADTLVSDGGADVLSGGEGGDTLAIVSTAFQRIAGGSGLDTLRLDGSGIFLNLTTIADNRLTDIEFINITGSGNNTLMLNPLEVLNLSSTSNTLLVRGDFGDLVRIGFGWTQVSDEVINSEQFAVFLRGAATLKVLANVTVTTAIDLSTLNGTTGIRLDGIDAGDQSGFAVSNAGDVNGDGFDDLLIGAFGGAPNGDSYAGESYLVFGRPSGFAAALDLSTLDGTTGFRLDGIDADDRSGVSVSSAGDVNGDGFDDLIIGANRADPNGDSNAGESYVVFGKSSGFTAALDLSTLDGTTGFRLDGVDEGDISGISVSSAGDVNGDGFDDLFIGAVGGDPNGKELAGKSYVVFGKSSGFAAALDLSTLDGTTGFRFDGIDVGDRSGISVSGAGDVNGDGFDDLLIGAIYGDPNGNRAAGESYVVFGKSSGFTAALDLSTLDGTTGFRLNGIDEADRSGSSVSGAGDVNGDGFDDLIIGASQGDPNGKSYAGESYVVFGKSSGFAAALDLSALDGTTGFRLDGIDVEDISGSSVSSAGDVNGDGFDDLLIGAYGGDPNGDNQAGESYVVFGKSSGFAATFNLSTLNGTNGFRLDGIDEADQSGRSVSSAGDFNGDGVGDLLIGAGQGDPNGNSDAGETYVVFGGNFTGRAETQLGTSGANTLTATQGAAAIDVLIGQQGADVLVSDGGADVLYGGEGNDTLAIVSTAFQRVAGGNGVDTLRIESSGITLDLATIADNRLTDIEVINISGSGDNTLTINLLEVLNLSSTSNTLLVRRNIGDTVNIGSGWTQGTDELIGSEPFAVFTQGAATLKVQRPASIDLSTLDGTTGFRLDGIDTDDRSGTSVSSAGDVNGDGFDDLLVGAFGGDPNGVSEAGETYVVFGKSSGFAVTLNLSTLDGSTGFRIDGIDAGGNTGRSVSNAGDLNGDGFDDLLIGGYRNGGIARPSYVIFGKSHGFSAALNVNTLDGTSGFRIDGIDANDFSGRSVSNAGDVNGDGFDDLLIGAILAEPNGVSRAGKSYVVFGKSGGFAAALDLDTLDGTTGFRLDGIDSRDYSGSSVSSAGDVNGDGFDDLLIGAFGAAPNGDIRAGESYVVFGKSGGFAAVLELSTLDGTTGFRLNGVNAYDYSGRSVSNAGDVNGDGFDDLLIGAFLADPNGDNRAGETYVVFGKSSGFASALDLSTLDGTTGFRLEGIDPDDFSGISVSSAGDVNGDGFDDLFIGAGRGDPNGDDSAGESYVVFGKSNGFPSVLNLATLNGATGFRLDGIDRRDGSGRSVSSAGDVNGDGFDDLLIGAAYGDPNGVYDAGESYVVFGRNFTGGAETQVGTSQGETLTATQGAAAKDVLIGQQGADTLVSDGSADVLYGGEGGDTLAIISNAFQRVAGGSGSDTLRIDGSGMLLNLTTIADNKLTDIEVINLTGSGNNTLTLNQLEVLNLSSTSNTLLVRGDAGDRVNQGSGWTQGANETLGADTFNVFTQGAATLKVQVEVRVVALVFTSSATPMVAEYTTTVVTLAATDTELDRFTFSISGGDDSDKFEIVDVSGSPVLRFKAANTPDFEALGSSSSSNKYRLTIIASDGQGELASQNMTVTVTDVNEAPTAVSLANTTTSLAENTSTVANVKVADIVINDDALGTNMLSLSGTDAGSFVIVGSELFVKSGTLLDFEAQSSYSVTVNVNDTSVGATPDASTNFILTLTKVNSAPTAVFKAVSPDPRSTSVSSVEITFSEAVSGVDIDDFTLTRTISGTSAIIPVPLVTASLIPFGDGLRFTIGDLDRQTSREGTYVLSLKSAGTDIVNAAGQEQTTGASEDWLFVSTRIETTGSGTDRTITISDVGESSNESNTNDNITLTLDPNDPTRLLITFEGRTVAASLDGVEGLVINGGAGDDTVILDASNGNLPERITFNGGVGGNDVLKIANFNAGFDAFNAKYDNASDGEIELMQQGATRSTVVYTGLEPITIEGTPLEAIFNLPNTNDTDVKLLDIADTVDGVGITQRLMRLSGSTFEDTDFSINAAARIVINTNGGNDRVTVQSLDAAFTGAVIVDGGAGNDTLIASSSNRAVTLFGGLGKDTLTGSAFGDSLDGGASNDLLTAGAGNDSLMGGAGNDMLDGGTGTDMVSESANANFTLLNAQLTGNGTDKLSNIEQAMLTGGASSNLLDASFFTLGNVTLLGGDGSDTLLGSAFTGLVDADRFNDSLNGGAGIDVGRQSSRISQRLTVSPTPGTNVVTGVGSDLWTSIEGLHFIGTGSAATTLDASPFAGSVTLAGGSGNDVLFGGRGPNSLNGNAGHDVLTGGDDTDTLSGGTGNDILVGNGGDDVLNGQAGNDTLRGNSGNDRMFGDVGNDKLFGGDGRDFLDGGAGEDVLTGEVGDDSINGGAGQDAISGGDGDDVLNGGLGNDTILGGSGNDVLRSEGGADRLSGGSGDDRFVATSSRISLGGGDDTVSGSNNKIDAVFVFDFEKLLL